MYADMRPILSYDTDFSRPPPSDPRMSAPHCLKKSFVVKPKVTCFLMDVCTIFYGMLGTKNHKNSQIA